jgi:hypothetical protein
MALPLPAGMVRRHLLSTGALPNHLVKSEARKGRRQWNQLALKVIAASSLSLFLLFTAPPFFSLPRPGRQVDDDGSNFQLHQQTQPGMHRIRPRRMKHTTSFSSSPLSEYLIFNF